jgi:hypothetical protein
MKAEKKGTAIFCWSDWGPHFYDIGVFDNCNTNTNNRTWQFGSRFNNETGLDGRTFFTGAERFQVREIELFEIRN